MSASFSSIHRVLIVDPDGLLGPRWISSIQDPQKQDTWLTKMDVQLIFESARTPDELLNFLRAGQFSTLVLAIDKPDAWLECMILAHQISPLTSSLVISRHWEDSTLRSFVNLARINRPLVWDEDETELRLHLGEAMLDGEILLTQENLYSESRQQNKELQGLTERLEQTVRERTVSIEKSKDDIEESLGQARNLIRFTQSAAQRSSFEDIMTLIRRELKKISKIGDPLLILRLQNDVADVLSFRSGLLQDSKVRRSIKLPSENSFFDKDFATVLANLLGRPIYKVLAFPLDVALIRKFGYPEATAVLCFEAQFTDQDLSKFTDEFLQILKPITIAVDRLFLERELTLQSYRWEKTFDGLRDPIAVIDKDRRVLRSNKKFAERAALPFCYQIFARRETSCEFCPLDKALQSGQNESSQIELNGKVFRVESYPIRLPDQIGAQSVVNQYTDITPTKETYARMLQTEKMSAIGMLAAHIAHELNNPLTGIQSLVQLLIKEAEDSRQISSVDKGVVADLQEIEKAARRSQKIIRNLLDFTGEGDHILTEHSFEDLWLKTYPLLKTILGSRNLQMQFTHSEKKVLVDPHLLQQVIFNIINNACQSLGPKGKLRVMDFYDSTKAMVGLSIKDSGPGIPEGLREKIFEPFFTTKKESQGTGLGLSLSREILRKSGGDLQLVTQLADSSLGGAEFWLLLPRSQVPS